MSVKRLIAGNFGSNYKAMKKLLFLLVLVAGFNLSYAQYSLTFCEDVSPEGKAQMVSNSFMVDGSGGVLKFLVKTEDKFNTDQLDFRIYYVNESGAEEELERLAQKIDASWNFAWKEMVLFDPGNYRVKIYTGKGTYLTSANLNVKKK